MNRGDMIRVAIICGLAMALGFCATMTRAQVACLGSTSARIGCLQRALNTEIAAREAGVADALNADQRIIAKFDELSARVKALEEAGSGLPPGPGPGSDPRPDPVPPPESGPAVLPAVFPSADDGRPVSQLGLGFFWDSMGDEPFANLARMRPVSLEATGWGAGGVEIKVTAREMWERGFIDRRTSLPTKMPDGTSQIVGGRFHMNAAPSSPAQLYVLEWEGDVDMGLDGPQCAAEGQNDCWRRVASRRIETRLTSGAGAKRWFWTRIGAGGAGPVRLFRAEDEPAIRAGAIVSPRWVALAGRYKVLRFMDPQFGGEFRPWRPGDFAPLSMEALAPAWAFNAGAGETRAPRHVSPELLFRMALSADAAAWVHVAGIPGAPASWETVRDRQGGESCTASSAIRKEAKRDIAAILASSDWAAYMDGMVAGMIAAGYPEDRLVILEPWNEVWNWAAPWGVMTCFAAGVADWLAETGRTPPGNSERVGYGFLAAKAMFEWDAALKRAGRRQAWTLALATQTVWLAQAEAGYEGFRAWFERAGADPAPWLAHAGLAVTSYYGTGFTADGFYKGASEAEVLAKWKAAIAADPVGLARRFTDWMLTADEWLTIPRVAKLRLANAEIARRYGAPFLGDYEGESHETPPPAIAADPVIQRWINDLILGPEGERLTRGWAKAMIAATPSAVIANYNSIGPRRPGDAPWFDGLYGEANGRTKGLEEATR